MVFNWLGVELENDIGEGGEDAPTVSMTGPIRLLCCALPSRRPVMLMRPSALVSHG